MQQRFKMVIVGLLVAATFGPGARARDKQAQENGGGSQLPSIPDGFAPVNPTNALASIWNDPSFTRRLLESYAAAPDVEPRVSPEEGLEFREQVVPLLRDNREKAIKKLEGMIQQDGSALFEFTLGNIYFQDGDLTNAVRYFEQAVAKFPDFRRAWQNLGFAFARDGRYGEAIDPITRSIALGSADSKAYGLLGFCYMNRELWVSAEAAYRQGMLLEPGNADYKLGIVKCQVAQENFQAALAMLNELIQLHPEREQYWDIQANIFLQTDQSDRAVVNLEMLRRMDKATVKNLILLGDIYMTRESPDLALPVYLEAIDRVGAGDLEPALRAAEIMVGRGAWEESAALFAKIREVGAGAMTTEDELKLLKLESKVAMATGSGGEAIDVLERIIARNPMDGEALLLAGDYYSRSGDKEKAAFRFELASKIEGYEADAYVKQAQMLAQTSKYLEAMELLRKAQKIKSRDNVQRYLEAIERVARTSNG
ncbi:MAG: tetratricopeptide repeat protein [Verrucomicrobia bacterium]|nr:tetratricopeptide repeat protein [Verrucomicrobiota bacterium]